MADPPRLLLSEALGRIHNGYVGLLRPTTREGSWIRRLGRSNFSHAVLFYRRKDSLGRSTLRLVEQIEPEGRAVPAEPYIRACPSGTFVVYRPKYTSSRRALGAVDWALENVPGVPYDKKGMFRSFLSHMPFFRWWIRPDDNDEANGDSKPTPLYCSAAVARACRVGGKLDLVPGLADRFTEPGDLAKSAALERLFTIVLPEDGR